MSSPTVGTFLFKKITQFRIEDSFDVGDDQSVAVDDALSESLEVLVFVVVTSHLDVIVALDFFRPCSKFQIQFHTSANSIGFM